MNTPTDSPSRFGKLYDVAEQQAGYFTAAQAIREGFSHRQLSYHTSQGHFLRKRRGVYRLTRFPHSPYEDLFIAWLVAGPNSVISHESALALYGLSDVLPNEIHIIMPRTASRRRKGIRLHTNRITLDDITRYAGLPVTTVQRTIVHVSVSGLADELIIQAVREGVSRGLVTKEQMYKFASKEGGRAKRLIHNALAERPG
ncbi:MAG: hypothetical protein GY759_10750 [Chloroflexi bacterium]|nr:hypothetical protein [Chloroflexota bacterium]